jgi:hypothetical protein
LELSFSDVMRPPSWSPSATSERLQDLRQLHRSPARDQIISDALDVPVSVERLIRDMQRSAIFNRLVRVLYSRKIGDN